MKRLAAAVTAAFLVVLAIPGVANAATTVYGGPSTSGTSPTSSSAPTSEVQQLAPNVDVVTPGGTVVVTGTGYDPFEWVDIYGSQGTQALRAASSAFVQAPAGNLIARVQADANGAFSLTIKLDQVGSALFTAIGATSGHVTTTTVTVQAAAAPGASDGSALPNTGVNRTLLLAGSAGGVLALIIGGGLVWLGATKRRSLHHAA